MWDSGMSSVFTTFYAFKNFSQFEDVLLKHFLLVRVFFDNFIQGYNAD